MTTRISSPRNKPLPNFEPGFNIQVAAARFDRMKLTLEVGIIPTGSLPHVHNLFKRIARGGRLFAVDGSPQEPRLSIRKRGWLFGGEIQATSHENGEHCVVKAYLEINPTRYYAHHTFPRRARYRDNDAHLEPLRAVEAVTRQLRGQSLDNNDNYIPEAAILQASREDWYAYTRQVVATVVNAIQVELMGYQNNAIRLQLSPNLKWTIRQIEIYWEYIHHNATAAVETFGEQASASFRSSRRWIHANSTSYIFDTSKKNIWNSLYAKLPNRVRIECRFDTYPRSTFAGDDRYRLPRYSRSTLNGFEECLPALARAAKDKAVTLRSAPNAFFHKEQPDLKRFSQDILLLLNHADYEAEFLESLLHAIFHTGKITDTERKQHQKLFSKLMRAGLLTKIGRKAKGVPQTYSIASSLRQLHGWIKAK